MSNDLRPEVEPLPVVDIRAPELVALFSAGATTSDLTGGKASALARAADAGLPVLPGVVLTTRFCESIDRSIETTSSAALHDAFEAMGGAHQALVVRSSSPIEDQAASSMAGQFDSVIGTDGFDDFSNAVHTVLNSRERAGSPWLPIAVLIQPLVEPVFGGVAFGIDPVTGRADRRVITAVAGRPGQLVSGETNGSRYVLDGRSRIVEAAGNDGQRLDRRNLQRVVVLVDRAAAVFGGPQDIEWAIDDQDRLWLLQSRPVTSENRGVPSGPLYGPGPVAETFPEALTKLERELWIPPLRDAVRNAVLLAGASTTKRLAATEVVISLGGRVAIDLELAGEVPPRAGWGRRLSPVPGLRKLRGAWRVGRLRAALPQLAERLLDRVDADLEAVPALDTLTSRQLMALLHRGQNVLQSLHAHEILMGMLTECGCGRLTGASVALRVLAEARNDGLDDKTILVRSPVVLALTAPAVRPTTGLPASATAPDLGQSCDPGSDAGVLREALRLRTRWVHEVTGRAAWVIGERLTQGGALPHPDAIRHLGLAEVEAIVTNRAVVLPDAFADHQDDAGEPLPACFQLSDRGRAIAYKRSAEVGGGTGAGGGAGTGPVTFDTSNPPRGSVLVTTNLAPGLGPVLPRLNGVVAETGSVLSHLAILAREFGVPTVVGYAHATSLFAEGTIVTVDGDTGDVTVPEVVR